MYRASLVSQSGVVSQVVSFSVSGMSLATTSAGYSGGVGDVLAGRENAGWTTSESGRPTFQKQQKFKILRLASF